MQNAVAATYVYTGVQYTFESGTDFTLTDIPSATFTTISANINSFAGSLIGNLSSILFSDGASNGEVFYNNPAVFPVGNVVNFNVTTDSNGDILTWDIDLEGGSGTGGIMGLGNIPFTTSQNATHFVNANTAGTFVDEAVGSWSQVTTTPAPALSTSLGGLLSVVLLGGLLMRNRTKAVTRS